MNPNIPEPASRSLSWSCRRRFGGWQPFIDFLDALDESDPSGWWFCPAGSDPDIHYAWIAAELILQSGHRSEAPKAALVLAACFVGLMNMTYNLGTVFAEYRLDALGNLSTSKLNRIAVSPWQWDDFPQLQETVRTTEISVAEGQALLNAAGPGWCWLVTRAYLAEGWSVACLPPSLARARPLWPLATD